MKITSEVIRIIKEKRGWSDAVIEQLQNPTREDLHDPFLLENMDSFIDALHMMKDKQITIIPDYDADGILSGSLLYGSLDLLGFNQVSLYEPRMQTGYGLTEISAQEALSKYPDTEVIITTDNGSNAHSGVKYMLDRDITVLITDHHMATDGDPVELTINPNRPTDTYPHKGLSGTAVAWKVMQAYASRYGTEREQRLIDMMVALVGISVISDVMPLLDENRYCVEQSIQMLQDVELLKQGSQVDGVYGDVFTGLYALHQICEDAGSFNYGFDESTLGFVFGPMLNAPRRMDGSSKLGFDVLLSKSYDEAYFAAKDLFMVNAKRKDIMKKYNQAYLTPVLTSDNKLDYLIGAVPYKPGLIGLVAGRFTSNFNLPSIVFGNVDLDRTYYNEDLPEWVDVVGGSGRSPEWFDLHNALTIMAHEHPEWFVSFGGHQQAAGVAIHGQYYSAFRERFVELVTERFVEVTQQMKNQDVSDDPTVWLGYKSMQAQPYDILLEKHWDTQELIGVVEFTDQLRPYGHLFGEPEYGVTFSTNDVNVFFMGKEKQHVKFTLPNGLVVLQWNGAETLKKQLGHLNGPFELSAIGPLSINEFNGRYTAQIIADQIIIN